MNRECQVSGMNSPIQTNWLKHIYNAREFRTVGIILPTQIDLHTQMVMPKLGIHILIQFDLLKHICNAREYQF